VAWLADGNLSRICAAASGMVELDAGADHGALEAASGGREQQLERSARDVDFLCASGSAGLAAADQMLCVWTCGAKGSRRGEHGS